MFQGQRELGIREVRTKTQSKGKVSIRSQIRPEGIQMSTSGQGRLGKMGK